MSVGIDYPFPTRRQREAEINKNKILINLSHSKYPIIPKVVASLSWNIIRNDNSDYDVYWSDRSRGVEKLLINSHYYQRINHFPKMDEIYIKRNLIKSLLQMKRLLHSSDLSMQYSNEYNFFPITWTLPNDYNEIVRYLDQNKTLPKESHNYVIIKPGSGAQGSGIYLADNKDYINAESTNIVQMYISNPMLIDGYKFDLRVYALILSCDPLRIYIYKDGLVRLCTIPYERPTTENMESTYMHLTNYSLNKDSKTYIQNNSNNINNSSKRTLQWLWTYLERKLGQCSTAMCIDKGICYCFCILLPCINVYVNVLCNSKCIMYNIYLLL